MKIVIEFPDDMKPFKALRYANGAFLGEPPDDKKGTVITFIDGACAYYSQTRTGFRLNIMTDGESVEDAEDHG